MGTGSGSLRRLALLPILFLCCSAVVAENVDPMLREALRQAITESDSFVDRFDAEVWLKLMSGLIARQVPDAEERIGILRNVHGEATRARLEPELVMAVIEVESNFDRFAVSRVGAQGLMQIMPFWLDELDAELQQMEDPQRQRGEPPNLVHVKTNLRLGCTILRYYLDLERGDLGKALARYNGSVGRRWYPDRVMTRLSEKFQHRQADF